MSTTHIERKGKNKKTDDGTSKPLTAGNVKWYNHFGKKFPTFPKKVKKYTYPIT